MRGEMALDGEEFAAVSGAHRRDPAHQPARRRRGRAGRRGGAGAGRSRRLRARARPAPGGPSRRRRFLRVRRRGADPPPPLRRGARHRRGGRARRPAPRALPGDAGHHAAAPGRRDRRPGSAATRLEERSLRRAHVQPAQPVREGDPRALHHHRNEAPALSRRAGGAPGDRVGGRAVPRGDLPALRPALRADARRAGGVRALRRSRATTPCAPSACRASASPASASGA